MAQEQTQIEQALLKYLETKPEINTVSVTNFAALCELAANVINSEMEQNKRIGLEVGETGVLTVQSMAYDTLESLIAICLDNNIDLNKGPVVTVNESTPF